MTGHEQLFKEEKAFPIQTIVKHVERLRYLYMWVYFNLYILNSLNLNNFQVENSVGCLNLLLFIST